MASDELKLLDAVQRYGMGNWDDMSVQVFNKSKSAKYVCVCVHYMLRRNCQTILFHEIRGWARGCCWSDSQHQIILPSLLSILREWLMKVLRGAAAALLTIHV